jgi:LPS export ABC transporter protein LptC
VNRLKRILIGFLLAILFTSGCSVKFKNPTNKNRDYPDFVLGNFRYVSSDTTGKREWELRAQETKMYNTKNDVYLYNLAMTFYNADNSVKSFLSANSGYVDKITMNIFAEGKVKIYSQNQAILETEKIHWNNDKKLFFTDPGILVTFIKGNSIQKGYNMMGDEGLQEVRIENINANVKK